MRARHLIAALLTLLPGQLLAQEGNPIGDLPIIGAPSDGGTGFQPAVTELARDLQWLDGMVLIIITVITVFVIGLIGLALVRYSHRRKKAPQAFTHNTPIEIAWTIVPIVILVFIGAFSLPVLFEQQEIPEADVTIKTTGYQWFWGYEYPDHGFSFDSYMIGSPFTGGDNRLTDEVREQLQAAGYSEDEFKLATDTAMVVPVGATVVVQVTGADVIHSWTIPAFGVKQDAVPGRLAELWFEAEEEGVYFGQCSELCGIAHAYMPITVKVVSQEAYEEWLDWAIAEYGGTPREVADAGGAVEAPAAATLNEADAGVVEDEATNIEEAPAASIVEQ
ncbi:cytochrome c oxidase subunit 2 [Palleronia marisminoris]|uniref:Cytochrome c oxidase subunit 2 n=1 Tax=Palleronia marisminoris TaxID=315423 RepID=A0A1Y5T3F1_9RHOB|nr:cytochrome c oxidase subunit II [Palleronia marisminoris]SFH15395.1 cytochrome c oxidase subunit 2 [Palleronia marisminoris]SLN54824.1 Cytochrome c oxidase subunit 2 precursor [Palleronia marisminoris]